MEIYGVSGHRELMHPDKLIEAAVQTYFERLQPKKIITGMAIGFDQLVADVCIKMRIPFVAAIPFDGQESIWPEHAKRRFYELLLKANEIAVVCEGGFAKWKLLKRNEWIVNNSEGLIIYMVEKRSGTKHCSEFAEKNKKPVFNIVDGLNSI